MWENFTHFDPHNKESTEGTLEFFGATSEFGKQKGWGPGMEKMNDYARWTDGRTTPKEIREKLLSGGGEAFRYQRKFKEAFDPNSLGDGYYRTLD